MAKTFTTICKCIMMMLVLQTVLIGQDNMTPASVKKQMENLKTDAFPSFPEKKRIVYRYTTAWHHEYSQMVMGLEGDDSGATHQFNVQPYYIVAQKENRMIIAEKSKYTLLRYDDSLNQWDHVWTKQNPDKPPVNGGDPRGRFMVAQDGEMYFNRGAEIYSYKDKTWKRISDFKNIYAVEKGSDASFRSFIVIDALRILATGGKNGIIQLFERDTEDSNTWKSRAVEEYPGIDAGGAHSQFADNAQYIIDFNGVYLYFPRMNYRMYFVDLESRKIQEMSVSWPTFDASRLYDANYWRDSPPVPQAMLFMVRRPDEILALAPLVNRQNEALLLHLGDRKVDKTESKPMTSFPSKVPYILPNGDWIKYQELWKQAKPAGGGEPVPAN